jgi:IS5 family transposase
VKVSLAVMYKSGLIVGARCFPVNPYDGHTLASQIEQTNVLLQDIGVKPTTAIVDLGSLGVDHLVKIAVFYRGRYKTMTDQQRRWIKRRQAIEPVIGHAKNDHGMRLCWLMGSQGDAQYAVLCAAGFNIRWLLRAIARGGVTALLFVLQLVALVRAYAVRPASGLSSPRCVAAPA